MRTRSEHETLTDELIALLAREDDPDLLIIARDKDQRFGMRVCGLRNKGDTWNALAMLEWAKYQILADLERLEKEERQT